MPTLRIGPDAHKSESEGDCSYSSIDMSARSLEDSMGEDQDRMDLSMEVMDSFVDGLADSVLVEAYQDLRSLFSQVRLVQ